MLTAMPALLPLLALCSLSGTFAARFSQSLPEDPYAFPKYRVSFLNGLPVLNDTAERWLRDGLKGGEKEFLEEPYDDEHWNAPQPWKEIDSGSGQNEEAAPVSSPSYRDRCDSHATPERGQPAASTHKLEHMKMGPKMSYLCLIPPPLQHASGPPSEEELRAQAEVTPVYSWSLLQPLSNSCLYVRPYFLPGDVLR